MKIGVLSDSHNNVTNIQTALAAFRMEGIGTIIHCGDLTSKETAATLGGFQVIHTIGNGDADAGSIRQALKGLNADNFSAHVFTGELGGVSIAVTHGHLNGKVEELVHSGLYRYVFFGHSHHRQDQEYGDCRAINPGALGQRADRHTALIIELDSGDSRTVYV